MIIGISGKKQNGKDTICNIIRALDIWDRKDELKIWTTCKSREEFAREFVGDKWQDSHSIFLKQSNWKKKAFADKLKQTCSTLLDVPVENWESGEFKNKMWRNGVTYRNVLQVIGDTCREKLHPEIWIDLLFNDYIAETTQVIDQSDKIKCNPFKEENTTGMFTVKKKFPNWIIPDVRMKNEAQIIKKLGGVLIRVNAGGRIRRWDDHISEYDLDKYPDFDFIVDNNGTHEELIEKIIPIYDRITITDRASKAQ